MTGFALHRPARTAVAALALAASAGAWCITPLEGLAREDTLQSMQRWIELDFKLEDDLALDPALRRDLNALASRHRERLQAFAAVWVDEELAQLGPGATVQALRGLSARVVARHLNATMLWQLDSTGEEHDQRTLRTLQDPGLCPALRYGRPFEDLALRLQRMSPADRSATLEAQRVMLERWGRPASVPDRPVPSLEECARAVAPALRGLQRAANEPPMSPVLAWHLLARPPRPLDEATTCSLVQWSLQRAALRSAPVAEQGVLVRYALAFDVGHMFPQLRDAAPDVLGYPPLAKNFEVQGTVRVQGLRTPGAAGAANARVTARILTVPGVRDVRPVAFERVFDQVALARAARLPPPEAGAPAKEATVDFLYKLD